uniref:F-box domain-containing protein n=1 Tax=Triticum urartu TaxID=4572 RepID=A0A8R7PG72_TRIUA
MMKKRRHRRNNVNATQKATLNKDAASSEEVGDRLSKLPNDILLNILERVDTLDAIRTYILSKRMMKLCTKLSQFFLSCSSIPGHNVRTNSEYVRTNSVVAHVTDNILSTRSPEITISKLKIRFILMQPDCYTIGKSAARTMATQKVGAAEFEIITEKIHKKCSPADLLDHAKQFNDFFSACLDAFAGLKRLWLRNMRFGELDIPNILTTCKLLESLHLTNCDSGMNSLVQLEHAKLTELEVEYGKFEIVELTCLPKLQRVSYKGWFNSHKGPLYFGFVPQLSKLRLTKIGTRPTRTLELSQLLGNVPYIGNLHLDFQSEKIWVLPESPKLLRPVLSQLQQVNLDNLSEGCDLAWTMFIIEAAPSLKELCITVLDHWCNMVMRDKEFRKNNGFCEKADVEWKPPP